MDCWLTTLDAVSPLQGLARGDHFHSLIYVVDVIIRLREGRAGQWKLGTRFGGLRHIVGVVEAKTPVAEIGTDDERVGRIGKIGS